MMIPSLLFSDLGENSSPISVPHRKHAKRLPNYLHLLPLAIRNLEAVSHEMTMRDTDGRFFLITISIVHVYRHISYFSFPHLLPLAMGNLEALSHALDERH